MSEYETSSADIASQVRKLMSDYETFFESETDEKGKTVQYSKTGWMGVAKKIDEVYRGLREKGMTFEDVGLTEEEAANAEGVIQSWLAL